MSQLARTTKKHGKGTYKPAPKGHGYDCAVSCHGKIVRSRQPDIPSAKAWIESTTLTAFAGERTLTPAQMLDAAQALAMLPESMTLTEAIKKYVPDVLRESPYIIDSIQQFISEKATTIKPVTLSGYRQKLNRFLNHIGNIKTCDITTNDIRESVSTLSGRNRNNALIAISIYFSWAIKAHHAETNPAQAVDRSRPPEPPRGILTLMQARALLTITEQTRPECVSAIAIALFAGLRPAELIRLDSSSITSDYIILDGAITKTATARTVTIRPNLKAFLRAYPVSGRVVPYSIQHWQRLIRELLLQAGVQKMPHDVFRHSFATYAYEDSKNAALIAAEMGHQGTSIFFRHYRALARPDSGKEYFSILPERCSVVVVNQSKKVKKEPFTTTCNPLLDTLNLQGNINNSLLISN